jgi:hypothetical protein
MMNAKCAVPESVSVFFFLGGLSSEALHLLLLNFWMPVPSLGIWNGVKISVLYIWIMLYQLLRLYKPWFFDDAAA